MAVPMASAARASGYGASDGRFFTGFGRSFIPLFCVFFVSIFLQIYFGVITFLYALVPLVISFFSLGLTQSLPDFDPDFILKGVLASAALLWLNSWLWSVSALAVLKSEPSGAPRTPARPPVADAATDLRALRKSRDQSL